MRVLFYCPNFTPARAAGGPIASSLGLVMALRKLGHVVDVFTTNVDGQGVIDVPLCRPVECDGVTVRYYPICGPRKLYYSPMMIVDIGSLIDRYDVVHTNGLFLWPGSRVAALARRARVPVVLSPRGMLVPDLIRQKSRFLKNIWLNSIERKHIWCSEVLHVTSDQEASDVSKYIGGCSRIRVIENGVSVPNEELDYGKVEAFWEGVERGKRIAFVGRIDWTKGLDLAVTSIQKVPGAGLVIVGPDQEGLMSVLLSKKKFREGSHVIRYVGPLYGKDKWALLKTADLLLVPSLRESFGMSVIEALAVGTPVICTTGVGAGLIVKMIDERSVVERDVESISSAVDSLLSDPCRLNHYRRKAITVCQDYYTWDAIAGRMVTVYNSAIEMKKCQ